MIKDIKFLIAKWHGIIINYCGSKYAVFRTEVEPSRNFYYLMDNDDGSFFELYCPVTIAKIKNELQKRKVTQPRAVRGTILLSVVKHDPTKM